MSDRSHILFIGGSGLLGSEFKKIRPDIEYPCHEDFDIIDYLQMKSYIGGKDFTTILHAAAFTSPPAIDKDPIKALEVNIVGTCNVVRLCQDFGLQLVYISTDYIFKGDRGLYSETDAVYPSNKYAWSKLGGECAMRLYDKALIIRTSFGPNTFPYEKAFVDQWTSRESVSVIARKINALLDKDITGVVHVGGERKTVHQYATQLDATRAIGKMSIHDVSFAAPSDTSLSCEKYEELIRRDRLELGFER